MKSLSLIALSLLSSSLALAAKPGCPELNLAGVWENGWGIRFHIRQDNCNDVIIRQEGKLKNFYLQLDGKTVMSVKGNRIDNIPKLVKYSETTGGWENRTTKPLVENVAVVGSLETNPYAGQYAGESKSIAQVNLDASILLPKDKAGKTFFPIKASMKASVSIYSYSGQDTMHIYLRDPKVTAVGEGEPGFFAKGFMTGLNALLSLQSFSYYNKGGESAYITGPRVFHELIDWKSRQLKRVEPKLLSR